MELVIGVQQVVAIEIDLPAELFHSDRPNQLNINRAVPGQPALRAVFRIGIAMIRGPERNLQPGSVSEGSFYGNFPLMLGGVRQRSAGLFILALLPDVADIDTKHCTQLVFQRQFETLPPGAGNVLRPADQVIPAHVDNLIAIVAAEQGRLHRPPLVEAVFKAQIAGPYLLFIQVRVTPGLVVGAMTALVELPKGWGVDRIADIDLEQALGSELIA